MKIKDEYCGIKTLKELREAKSRNSAARDAASARCSGIPLRVMEQFSIKTAVAELRQALSPLVGLYRIFACRKG